MFSFLLEVRLWYTLYFMSHPTKPYRSEAPQSWNVLSVGYLNRMKAAISLSNRSIIFSWPLLIIKRNISDLTGQDKT